MPTYEYACMSCGTHVEVYQRFSEAPLTDCGVCGGQLRKVFHPAGILFKGSGFYKTDSRSASKTSGEKKKETSEKPSEKKTASTDKAPAASSEGSSSAASTSTPATKEKSA